MKFAGILCVNSVFLFGVECGFLKDLFGTVTDEIHKVKEDVNGVIEYKKQVIKNTIDFIGTEAKEIHNGVGNIFKKKDKSEDKNKKIETTQSPPPENNSTVAKPHENNSSNGPIVNSTENSRPVVLNKSSDDIENKTLEVLNPLIDIRSNFGNISSTNIVIEHKKSKRNTKDIVLFSRITNINNISTTTPLAKTIIQGIRSFANKMPNSEKIVFEDNSPIMGNESAPENGVSKCPGDLVKAADGSCLKPVEINMSKNDMKAANVTMESRNIFRLVGCFNGTDRAADNSCQPIIH